MRKLSVIATLLASIGLSSMIPFFSVYAQDVIDTTPLITITTPIEPVATETPTPTDTPYQRETSTVEYKPSETQTFIPSDTPTLTITNTSTYTSTSRPPVFCSLDEIYQFQIVVSYTSASITFPSDKYTLVRSSVNDKGETVSVLQVDPADYCSILAELKNNLQLLFAEPNYEISLLDTIPNDGYYASQYYFTNIRAPQGWDYETGSPAVIIAVLDTGVDLNHSDLASKLTPGWDFVQKDNLPQDENGHGTHVAGIAAAATNNGAGIAGVSWGAAIMPLRVLDAYGNGSYANTAEAIRYAVDHGARVINMSIGGVKYSEVLESAVNYASSLGVIMVAATGNSGGSTVLYPAAFAPVIAVGATDSANQRASFSNTGNAIDVMAPGVSIFSTYPGNQYGYKSGTSMATPMVSGFAALLASLPGMNTSMKIIGVIQTTALDLGSAGWDTYYGHGLIQIGPGIMYALGYLPTMTPTPSVQKKTSEPPDTLTSTVVADNFGVYVGYSNSTAVVGEATVTVTPGEISIQQVTMTASPSVTHTNEVVIYPSTGWTPETENHQLQAGRSPLFLVFGIFYVFIGVWLFFFVHKRYFR